MKVSLGENLLLNHKNPGQFTLDRFPQYAKWWWGGCGDRRRRHFKLCVWVCVVYVWEEKSKVQTIFLSLQPPAPASPPHTLWTWYRIIRVVLAEALGWRREGELRVKCLLEMHCGVFSCMGNRSCQASPMPCAYLIWLAASASGFV